MLYNHSMKSILLSVNMRLSTQLKVSQIGHFMLLKQLTKELQSDTMRNVDITTIVIGMGKLVEFKEKHIMLA